MKYLTITKSLFILLLMGSIFSACKNDNPQPVEVEKPVLKPAEASAITTLRTSIAALHPEDQLAIIGSLPPEYTYALWKDRLNELKENAETEEESELLSLVFEGLTLSMYTDEEVSSETQSFVDNARTMAMEVYNNDKMQVLSKFTTLGESTESVGIAEGGGAALPNCDCTTSGIDLECNILDDCVAGSCTVVKRACGFMDIYNCNGLCK